MAGIILQRRPITNDDHAGDWLANSPDSDPQFSQRPIDEVWEDNFEVYSLTMDYDFGAVKLTSVTGYYERELFFQTDHSRAVVPVRRINLEIQ